MADCDLLAPEGYQERPLGPLTLRVAAVQAPAHPLGSDYTEPHYGVFGCAERGGWIALAVPVLDAEAMIATLDTDGLERAERLSILIGASWPAFVASARTVVVAQEDAVVRLPPQVYGEPPENLRTVRSLINSPDPNIVGVLLGMAYHFGYEEGGYRGPRFA